MHSNESACRKSGRLGLEQVIGIIGVNGGDRGREASTANHINPNQGIKKSKNIRQKILPKVIVTPDLGGQEKVSKLIKDNNHDDFFSQIVSIAVEDFYNRQNYDTQYEELFEENKNDTGSIISEKN